MIAQQLGVCAAITEDLHTHWVAHNHLNSRFRRSSDLFWSPQALAVCPYANTGK